jgi:hypothetical protein
MKVQIPSFFHTRKFFTYFCWKLKYIGKRFIIPSPCEKLGKKVWPGRLILDLGPLQVENIFNC